MTKVETLRSVVAAFTGTEIASIRPETLINLELGVDNEDVVFLVDACAEAVGFEPKEQIDLSPYISAEWPWDWLLALLRIRTNDIAPLSFAKLCKLVGVDVYAA
jgi:hypothetical protein